MKYIILINNITFNNVYVSLMIPDPSSQSPVFAILYVASFVYFAPSILEK